MRVLMLAYVVSLTAHFEYATGGQWNINQNQLDLPYMKHVVATRDVM